MDQCKHGYAPAPPGNYPCTACQTERQIELLAEVRDLLKIHGVPRRQRPQLTEVVAQLLHRFAARLQGDTWSER